MPRNKTQATGLPRARVRSRDDRRRASSRSQQHLRGARDEWRQIRRSLSYSCLGFADPAVDGGITTEIEAAFMRDARIGKQRDVGKRNVITGEEAVCRQMLLHAVERRIAALDLFRIELGGVLAEIDELEAAHRDIGLVAVLFPEQPFVHLGGSEGVARNER